MKKIIIVGAGGFGRVVLEHAVKEYKCVFIDDGIPEGTIVDGATVVGKVLELGKFLDYKNLIVAIGDNCLREQIYYKAKKLGFSFPNIIHPSVYISPYASVGSGCVFLNNVVIQNNSHCGNGVILNPGVELHHDSFVDDYSLIYTNSVIRSSTHVGKRVWIGSNVTISTQGFVFDDGIIEDNRNLTNFENTSKNT